MTTSDTVFRNGKFATLRLAWLVGLLLWVMALSASAACSSWFNANQNQKKVWFNEYFFGSGSSAPPNFLELYTTSSQYATSWQGSYVEVYTDYNTKSTYTFNNSTATACTTGNKTWITHNVTGGLRQQNGLAILKDPSGNTIDAFVFDNTIPPAPWKSATDTWAPGYSTGCPDLDVALSSQAAQATSRPSKQANLLVLDNYGNKDFSRFPDGGAMWDATSNTGAGTTYTQCLSNNANFTKTVDNTTPSPGTTVTFTLALTNIDSTSLTGIAIDDYLPNYPVVGAPTYLSATPTNTSDSVSTSTYSATDPNTGTTGNATKLTWNLASVASGATSKLIIKMQVPTTATEHYIYNNTAQTVAGLNPTQTDFANITIGSLNVGSFVITVTPASASTCTPALLGPKVTITAMTGPNGTGIVHTGYGGSPYLFASTANPKWHNSTGTLISVAPVPAGSFVNGVATFYLTDAAAETITVSALDTLTYSPSVMQGVSGNITFTAGSAGLVLTDADILAPAYGAVAGRPHKLRATLTSCGATATSRTGSYSGTFSYTPGLNHPVGASAPTLSTTAACPGSASTITLPFNAGISDVYLCTTDVGQFAVNLGLSLTSPTESVSGTSGNFTVRPFAITATGFPSGGTIRAGNPFTGSFNAWLWHGGSDANNDGQPDGGVTAASLAAAAPGRPPRFSGVTNDAGVARFKPKLRLPSPGTLGTLTPTAAIAIGGTVSLADLAYSEVGSIALVGADTAGLYGATNYLGMAGLNVPFLSNPLEDKRFIPDHFDTEIIRVRDNLIPTLVPMDCASGLTCPAAQEGATPYNAMVYAGQAFSVRVTARNLAGGATANYAYSATPANSLSKAVTLSAVASNGGSVLPSAAPGGTLANAALAASLFAAGSATLATPAFSFAATPTAPTNVYLRATESAGGDNVTSLRSPTTASVEGGVKVVSGRMLIENMYAPPKARMAVKARTLYWNGSQWTWNHEDSTSGKSALSFELGAPDYGTSIVSAAGSSTGGEFLLMLAPPSDLACTSRCTVMLNSKQPHLPGSGRETWGTFRAPYIYQREW